MKKLIIMLILTIALFGCTKEPIVGGDKDEHGCIGSAGYQWCEAKQKCLREWEEPCETSEFCDDENVVRVEQCGEYTKVISSLPGGGATYHKDGSSFTCPVVGPDSISDECKAVMDVACVDVCSVAKIDNPIVGDDEDEHGCKGSAGYVWCEEKQKCLRIWEEPCGLDKDLCEAGQGMWNECGSRCQIDNQNELEVACNLMCEQLCECGTLMGYGCPDGYTCAVPAGIADAKGYCEKI